MWIIELFFYIYSWMNLYIYCGSCCYIDYKAFLTHFQRLHDGYYMLFGKTMTVAALCLHFVLRAFVVPLTFILSVVFKHHFFKQFILLIQ